VANAILADQQEDSMTDRPGLKRPLRQDEIDHYREHGVVHLRGLLDLDWVAEAERAFDIVMSAAPEDLNLLDIVATAAGLKGAGFELLKKSDEPEEGRFWVRTFNWMKVPELAALGTRSFLPEVAAALFGADRIHFFGDQLFLKEPRSLHRTAFHQDAPYFHLEGDQCCTMWMPLDVVDRDNGAMGYVRGSHRWPIHTTNVFVSQEPIPGSVGERLPDIEGHEDDFDVVYYESEPGDVIVHHVRTVHGSTGNLSADRVRRAVTLRYLGDDTRYLERTGAPPDSAKSPSLESGDRMDSPEFPLVWTRSKGYVATP
jgi:ectoine hydroxylase-related dioxygenase (phytanoyl-CoA dioxygenase family)